MTEVAVYRGENGSLLGLDEVDAGDMITPRFSINHNKGVWENNQTDAGYAGMTAILLCRVKQRIMWKSKLEDKADPQCRSNNFRVGFPNMNPRSKSADLFPWPLSNFDQADYAPDPAHNNLVALPCDSCDFRLWHGEDKPLCKEQWTFAALVYLATAVAPEGEWLPGLITIQGTGIPAVRPYISDFIQRRAPLFTQMTTITLKAQTKAGNEYYVPVFQSGGGTDPEQWNDYASRTVMFMEYLKQDPRNYNASDSEDAPAVSAAPTPTPAPAVSAAPTPTPAPAEQEIVDAEVIEDVSVSSTVPETPAAQPAAPAAAPAAPATPAAPTAPAQPTAPAPAAPAQPAVASAPAAAPAAPAPAAPAPAAPAPAAPAQPAAAPVVTKGALPF